MAVPSITGIKGHPRFMKSVKRIIALMLSFILAVSLTASAMATNMTAENSAGNINRYSDVFPSYPYAKLAPGNLKLTDI